MEILTEYGTELDEIKKKLKIRIKDLDEKSLMLELKAEAIWKHNRNLMRSSEEKLSDFNKSEELSEIDLSDYASQNDYVYQRPKTKPAAKQLVSLMDAYCMQKQKSRRKKNQIKLKIKKMLFDEAISQVEALLALEQIITKFHSNVGIVNYVGMAIGFNLERNSLLVLCFDKEATPDYFQNILREYVGKADVKEAIDLMEKLIVLKNTDFRQEKLEILKKILNYLETEKI